MAKTFNRLRILLICAVTIVWLVNAGITAARPPQQSITSEIFWQQVDQTITWLNSKPSAVDAAWQVEADRWENIREVSLEGKQIVQVDTSHIVQMMRAKPPNVAEVSTYFSALKRTQSLTTKIGGERESKLLSEILARSEFQYDAREPNFFQKFIKWLQDGYNRLMELLLGDRKIKAAIPTEITLPVTLVLITAILALVFRDTLRNLFSEVELTEETPGEGEVISARIASQKAQALSNDGDYRHALRYLYLSALLLLDERGLLRYNRAQTNREYLRQLRERPDLSAHLKEVVETFDRVWYGYQPIDEANYTQYADHVTALEETKE